jgi:hypothetical protein
VDKPCGFSETGAEASRSAEVNDLQPVRLVPSGSCGLAVRYGHDMSGPNSTDIHTAV